MPATAVCTPPVPFPFNSPVRVVEPVPPFGTVSAVARVSAPAEENDEVAVAPKLAVFAERVPVKKFVEVALVAVRVARAERPETLSAVSVPTLVRDEVTTVGLRMDPLSVPAGAITTAVLAAVRRPFESTVKVGIAVELPYEFAETVVLARVATAEPGPEAVTSPVRAVMYEPGA